ncbi:2-amino-4-hydroxy-6-hydroxymethyldihydropteridine diphosphokinase [Methylocella sp.]|jgi:2-amino-4-hydroxy-6-hydroxymethyldihydropteridine diphosphokinase|uniref:2-amino-4-hydroxy-6- hydroxymethyldihydropteridine diphosphokinase n=1 Tax=Methylocella sp. TaxID=1978226 RepID=UPI003C139260
MPSAGPDRHAPTPVEIGLGLGSNIGDKPANIARALAHLAARGAVTVTAVSSIYRTAPWGYLDQEDFANACALATTTLEPAALLAEVKAVEAEMGRTGGVRWGPRLIDIDILFFGAEVFDSPELVLPHKELFNRAFVLAPLAEIAPHLWLGGRSVAAAAAEAREGVEKWFKS